MGLGIEAYAVPFHRAVFGTLPAAEYGADAEHELPHAEGLDHIVISAKGQTDNAVHFLAAGREHEHRYLSGVR